MAESLVSLLLKAYVSRLKDELSQPYLPAEDRWARQRTINDLETILYQQKLPDRTNDTHG